MSVVTRFAPSPTGFLHIGGARTALFNWLFARHHGGRFLLRIEDTDRARSTDEAVDAIYEGLRWLGLDWDGDAVSQFERAPRHVAVARDLLDRGLAYHCYATPDELTEMRERARAEKRPVRYDGRWRDRDPAEAPPGVPSVIRLKAPRDGETRIEDMIQGEVAVANDTLDDMVLVRSDGSPTYMLAVVVDDHDMGITHVIRGDDHLTNTFRQLQIYAAFGWSPPRFAHMSLIHGTDGAKLSKRHGALGVEAYRDQGILPEALCNYLVRLGWSHGDDEIIARDQAIAWFDLDGVGRSPARFDAAKLASLNAHYIRQASDAQLTDMVLENLATAHAEKLAATAKDRIMRGMTSLKERAKTIIELTENAKIYALDGVAALDPKAAAVLNDEAHRHLRALTPILNDERSWTAPALEEAVRGYVDSMANTKLKAVAQPLRAALTGSTVSPPVFEVMEILGQEETLARLDGALTTMRDPVGSTHAAQDAS